MSQLETENRTEEITVAAAPETVFQLLRDVARWPQWHGPAVHAEVLERDASSELVRNWALAGENRVRVWDTRRTLDPASGSITFERVCGESASAGGSWVLSEGAGGTTGVRANHESGGGRAPEPDGGAPRTLLTSLKDTAERAEELDQLVISFEDPLFVDGSPETVYGVLNEADRWPTRMAHVTRLDMTEEVPGIQFFDMETRTPDGSAHTTRSVRVCLPHRKIVYKQIRLPKLLDAHTGHWEFSPTPEGLTATARHTATIRASALSILGEGTSVRDARRYLRRVLGANSLANLQVAKRIAEGGGLG